MHPFLCGNRKPALVSQTRSYGDGTHTLSVDLLFFRFPDIHPSLLPSACLATLLASGVRGEKRRMLYSTAECCLCKQTLDPDSFYAAKEATEGKRERVEETTTRACVSSEGGSRAEERRSAHCVRRVIGGRGRCNQQRKTGARLRQSGLRPSRKGVREDTLLHSFPSDAFTPLSLSVCERERQTRLDVLR